MEEWKQEMYVVIRNLGNGWDECALYSKAALSLQTNEWKAGWVPAPSEAEPGILNCTAPSLILANPHTVPDFSDSNQRVHIYRVIEKDGRDLVRAPLLGLSVSIYFNSTCFHRLNPSNKKL